MRKGEKVDGIDRGLFCHARRRVVGEERPSKSRARRAADDAWMGAVRYDRTSPPAAPESDFSLGQSATAVGALP